jgi:galactokinase/mevalonate kinase-like predicted kinase
MIITKTPLRVSFLRGSFDLPSYYSQKDGLVGLVNALHYMKYGQHIILHYIT